MYAGVPMVEPASVPPGPVMALPGAYGKEETVHYLAPDTLEWED